MSLLFDHMLFFWCKSEKFAVPIWWKKKKKSKVKDAVFLFLSELNSDKMIYEDQDSCNDAISDVSNSLPTPTDTPSRSVLGVLLCESYMRATVSGNACSIVEHFDNELQKYTGAIKGQVQYLLHLYMVVSLCITCKLILDYCTWYRVLSDQPIIINYRVIAHVIAY